MVSPLKGLTRAQITARAAARKAAEAAKKASKKPRKKRSDAGKSRSGKVRVSQATVNRVKGLGRTAARAQASKPGASAEFKEAVRRIYPDRKKRKS